MLIKENKIHKIIFFIFNIFLTEILSFPLLVSKNRLLKK